MALGKIAPLAKGNSWRGTHRRALGRPVFLAAGACVLQDFVLFCGEGEHLGTTPQQGV